MAEAEANLDVAVYDAEQALRQEELALQLQEQAEREQAELELIKAAVGTIFSVRKPRDAVAGTASGLKTMARGVGVGLASLVTLPAIGAKTGGIKGFAKGCGTGLATCVGSTVAGTLVGSGQIVRGVVNTPGAIFRTARGEVWNPEKRRWEKDWYSLPDEAAEVLGNSEASEEATSSGSRPSRPARKVAHRELYDLLGVAPEASEAEIRKAFYKKSLALHPDKNPDNPEATKQFQAVSDAYRILGDDDRRRAYDELGKDTAAANMPKIEPVVFFAALFGTHHFEPYVGRLRLAQDIDTDMQSMMREIVTAEDEESGQVDILKVSRAHKRMQVLERQRQVQCAVDLARRLDSCAEATWEADRKAEAKHLSEVPFGAEMLYHIGWLYVNGAEQWLAGSALRRLSAKVEARAHLLKSKGAFAAAAGRTAITVNSIMKTVEKKHRKSEKGKSEPKEASKEASKEEVSEASKEEASKEEASKEKSEKSKDEDSPSRGFTQTEQDSHPTPSEGQAGGQVKFKDKSKDTRPRLKPGTIVMLRNLRCSAELNEQVGIIECFDEQSERYVVQFLNDSLQPRKLKAENLLVVEDSADQPEGSEDTSASSEKTKEKTDKEKTDSWAPGGDEAEMAEAFKDTMPLFHDTLWSVTAIDIEYTLAKVMTRVLRDMSVSKECRQQRAEALHRLGKILQEPMKEKRKVSVAPPSEAPVLERQLSSRSSILARLPRLPWRSRRRSKEASQEFETKQKQMEAALVLMAAGASTDDVDEMLAARTAMESEFDSFHGRARC
ncbi:unnamed protein product [Effrenium voratum]|uniref:J domain-containing protein n=1 Tax=Effrenium voratum TaxID=2562239 RepID=A0AA36MVG0_9DINO|nr:unnamed protein product [Effrenium voratum]CAJ1460193.1 unnamed protein product [Effrenium voratum]